MTHPFTWVRGSPYPMYSRYCAPGRNRTYVTWLKAKGISPLLRVQVYFFSGHWTKKVVKNPKSDPSGTRTQNSYLKRVVLYQLSYEGILSSLLYEKLDILCTRRESNPRHLVKSQGHIPFATSASLLFFGTLD